MQAAIDSFQTNLAECLVKRDCEGIKALNMPDDITGWGLYPEDVYESHQALEPDPTSYKSLLEKTESTTTPLLVLSNNDAVCLVCDFSMTHTLKSGEVISQPDLRLSWFLYFVDGELKVRHGHLSQAVPQGESWPNDAIPTRLEPTKPADSRIIEGIPLFLEQLDRRSEGFAKKDVDLLLSLNSYQEALYWGPTDQPSITSREQHFDCIERVIEHTDSLSFYQPVVYQQGSLVCMSAYAAIGCKQQGRISPVRATYFLQQAADGQWFTHHAHLSVPVKKSFSESI